MYISVVEESMCSIDVDFDNLYGLLAVNDILDEAAKMAARKGKKLKKWTSRLKVGR